LSQRIAVLGGGPAGLYSALLLKDADRTRDVVVHERNPPDVTFGFGVVFSDPTLDRLLAKDPRAHADLLARSERWNAIEVRLGGSVVRTDGQGFSAVSRRALLAMLQARAREAGVELRFQSEIQRLDELAGYDLVIAADGLNSLARGAYEEAFRPQIEAGAAKYIWFGTTRRFDALTFLFEENEHGAFAVHAYPFAEGESTFLVECDEAAWRRAGLDRDDDPRVAQARSMEYCKDVFARHLGDHELLANASRWLNFRTVRAARWWHENVVLLGDAAHTAHFSVGSGTKMAMEDALALRDALDAHARLPDALDAFEKERRADVERLQASSGPSLAWWEHFGRTMYLSPEAFVFHFLTRNQKLTRASVRRRDPAFVEDVEGRFRSEHGLPSGAPASSAPLRTRSLRAPSRLLAEAPAGLRALPDDARTDGEILAWGERARADGADAVVVRAASRGAPLVRALLACDALRHGARLAVVLDGGGLEPEEIETSILARRIDAYVAPPAAR